MARRRLSHAVMTPVRALDARGRMTPSYLVVGTKRGGSSALAEWITRHPQVAPSRAGKGSHYFDVNHWRGEAWFRSRFEKPRPEWRITGEASPYYMFHPLAPARMRETLPEARLIVVLREPVARAWSHFRRETDTGFETLTFPEALAAEDSRLEGELERLRTDPTHESYAHRHHTYRTRGHYAEQLRVLHEQFGPEQVLVVQSEAMFADPNRELERVWAFLGVDPVRLDDLRPVKPSAHEAEASPAVVEQLHRYYRPLNEELYRMPGVDFQWPAGVTS